MERVPIETSATERARWLGQLAEALKEAQKVAWRLGVSEGDSSEGYVMFVVLV